MTEPLIQSQDTPIKHFTTSETGNFRNEFLAFKIHYGGVKRHEK